MASIRHRPRVCLERYARFDKVTVGPGGRIFGRCSLVRIVLETYYLPGDLEASISRFVDHYNHERYHENLDKLTPADVYFGRGQAILLERERIKRNTIQKRRLQHQKKAA